MRGGTIDILNVNFYDSDGKILYKGGAERYISDLAVLIREVDYGVRIIQNANFYFEKEYLGFQVIGLPTGGNWGEPAKISEYYATEFPHGKYTICSPLELACRLSTGNMAMGINHGIAWDHPGNRLEVLNEGRHRSIFDALRNVDAGVCVDTNFINWVRTYDYSLAEKLIYIPNYYDSQQFKDEEKEFLDEEINILYPRRLTFYRGIDLALRLADYILRKYDNVNFHFVGQADNNELEKIRAYLDKYSERIKFYELDMCEMHKSYVESQIVIIPTVFAEGTSLSCIEAMATNNAVIATNVGGLPNLIIHGFNGMLVNPNEEDLKKNLEYLIENKDERVRLASNAREAVKAFEKGSWEKRWIETLTNFINQTGRLRLVAERNTLANELRESSIAASALRSEFEKVQNKLSQAGVENASLSHQLLQVKEELEESRNKLKDSQNEIQSLETLNDAASAKLEQSQKRLKNILFTTSYAISLIQNLNSSKSMRVAKFMKFTKERFVDGALSTKMRYLKQILNRVIRKKPLDTGNLLNQVEYEMQVLGNVLEEEIRSISTRLESPDGRIAQASRESSPRNTFSELFAKQQGLRIIRIVTPLFYDADGKRYLFGGSERYHVEIGRIALELGFSVELWQIGSHNWELEHHIESGTIRVLGVECPSIHDYFEFNKRFHERATYPVALVIYSPFVIAYPEFIPNSIGISHGIFWDNPFYQEPQANAERWNKTIIAAISNCRKIVSVDTNTINWLRAVNYSLADRLFHVPNFVDTKKFNSERKDDDSRLRIIFPRRICKERGSDLARALASHLMEQYDHVDFDFIGTGDLKEEVEIKKLEKKYPNRINAYCLPPDEMHNAYVKADICIIPTRNSEGTSLSCLEAMASANAVVATNVGGLTDLILNNFNGILISPSLDELVDAVERLIRNDSLRKTISQNARETSKIFDLEKWREKWRGIIKETSGIAEDVETKTSRKRFIHLCHPGIAWSYMQQRPHQLIKALGRETDWELLFVTDEDIRPFNAERGIRILPYNSNVKLDENTWAYIYNPNMIQHRNNYEIFSQSRGYHILFDVFDDPMIHADFYNKTLSESSRVNYEALLSGADIVIASGESIKEKIESSRSDTHLVANGVFLEDFQVKAGSPRPKDLPDNKKILGFHGALYEWRADYELIGKVANTFQDYAVVIIGPATPIESMKALLNAHSNVIHLPAKPYSELNNYIRYFDVAFIPFLVNEVTNGMSTIKFFEYCAARKPVVSTGFREIKKYKESGVCIANNHEEFLSAIGKYLENPPNESEIEKFYEIAKKGTWSARAKSIISLIKSFD